MLKTDSRRVRSEKGREGGREGEGERKGERVGEEEGEEEEKEKGRGRERGRETTIYPRNGGGLGQVGNSEVVRKGSN